MNLEYRYFVFVILLLANSGCEENKPGDEFEAKRLYPGPCTVEKYGLFSESLETREEKRWDEAERLISEKRISYLSEDFYSESYKQYEYDSGGQLVKEINDDIEQVYSYV